MTHEEMEKTMQFIIERQAQFASDIQQLKEVQRQLVSDMQQMVAVQTTFQTQLEKLTDATITFVTMAGRVAEAQVVTEQRVAETNAKLAETDERLNIFINVVERYISGHNGKAEG